MDNFDPADYYEDDPAMYEDRYADDLDNLADFEEEEEIDFEKTMKPKSKTAALSSELNKILSSSPTPTGGPISDQTSVKRNSNELLDITGNFQVAGKENCAPLSPKRLKFDSSYLDGDIDFGVSSVNDSKTKDITRTINQLKSSSNLEPSFDEEAYHRERRRVFTRPIFSSDNVNVTNTEGDRVFMKICSESELPTVEEKRWLADSSESGLNLLSVPFNQLKREVEQRIHAQRVLRVTENTLPQPDQVVNTQCGKDAGDLWVEKYTPRKYTELLSDDGTNRFVLKWLKLWDQVVFGIEKPKKESEKENMMMPGGGKDQQGGGGPNSWKDNKGAFQKFEKKFYNPEDDLVQDVKGRPKKKLALLCGNPGLGKTTLAHVISKHAGYQVVEMNASDDRSPEVFLNKIETSTQMKAVIGQTKKPNCLVIDEIDGAPIQAINILLDIVKTTESYGSNKGGAKVKKKKKKREFILNRPIICICNDQFVPALRQLRQVAFTIRFPPTLPSRLAGRLLSISKTEKMRIDMTCLLQLADKTENDIRSCLNTLQFIHRKKKELKAEDLKNMEVGQKDMKKGVRTILTEVFQLPKKKILTKFVRDGDTKSALSNRFHYILHMVHGNSEFDKLMQGLFDQYLHCKTKDPYLESINLGNDWLGFTDILKHKVASSQDYVLWRFLSFLPVAFHLYFARANPGKIQYSNVAYENSVKLGTNRQTLSLVANGMSPYLRRNCSSDVMTSDLLPYLFSITLPNLRAVNTNLYSESEKQVFSSLVHTLIAYNLTYRQERTLEGQYTYVLEPNIEEVVTFPGLPGRKQLLYATKQLIAREVELEKMRRAERPDLPSDESSGKPNSGPSTSKAATSGPPKNDVVKKQKLVPKPFRQTSDRPQFDFFGRVIKPDVGAKATEAKKKSNVEDSKISLVMNTKTWFRFNEGYTNAVRRTIKMPEFL